MAILHEKLSGEIIGAAMQVLNTLKPGLDEKLYENALRLELEASGHQIRRICVIRSKKLFINHGCRG